MSFDQIPDRRNTHSLKWDMMDKLYGVSPDDGLAMWVADTEYQTAPPIRRALQDMVDHGVFGYFGDDSAYREAICWWSEERHGWAIDPSWIFTTSGLVHAVATCIETFTRQGDGIVLFTPVYHAFSRVIRATERQLVECELKNVDGRYEMDFDAYEAQMTGNERMLILCSPHNPGGRVWTKAELEAVAAFARRHDLLLLSDEIHRDLLMPGEKHISTALIDGTQERLITLVAPSKTFNIAGSYTGQVIIADPALRAAFAKRMSRLSISSNSFGLVMTTAAYTPEGAAWVDDLCAYLDGNRKLFDEGVAAVPGLVSMPLEATFLAWVDFAGTGMTPAEFTGRVERDAKIAVNHGDTFGKGGETFLRFNIGTSRAQITDAVTRLQNAFADLQ